MLAIIFYGDFSYSELNVRTCSMIILFCGLLFSIVILCLTIINYYSKRFAQRSLLLAQSDPFVLPVSSNIASSNYFQQSEISRSIPLSQTIQTTLNEQPQQQDTSRIESRRVDSVGIVVALWEWRIDVSVRHAWPSPASNRMSEWVNENQPTNEGRVEIG